MSDSSFLDFLPSHEQQKLKRRMSASAYEKLREKVKGPEDLEREMKRSETLAELHFGLESDPHLQEKGRERVAADIKEQGIEVVMDSESLSPEHRKKLEQGKFRLTVSSHPSTHQDQLAAVPEGNVQEKIPLKAAFSDKHVSGLRKAA